MLEYIFLLSSFKKMFAFKLPLTFAICFPLSPTLIRRRFLQENSPQCSGEGRGRFLSHYCTRRSDVLLVDRRRRGENVFSTSRCEELSPAVAITTPGQLTTTTPYHHSTTPSQPPPPVIAAAGWTRNFCFTLLHPGIS
jgi:hypothetical protein